MQVMESHTNQLLAAFQSSKAISASDQVTQTDEAVPLYLDDEVEAEDFPVEVEATPEIASQDAQTDIAPTITTQ